MSVREMNRKLTFAELVASYRGKKRWTQARLAAEASTSPRTISNIETGKRPELGATLFQKLIELLDIPWEEIPKAIPAIAALAKIKESLPELGSINEQTPTYDAGEIRAVPVINLTSCGSWSDLGDLEYPAGHAADYAFAITEDDNAFFVVAHGDSMEDEIFEGDRLLVEPNQEARNGDIVLAKTDSGTMIKRFERVDDNTILLKPENSKHETIIVRAAEFPDFVCYPVTQIMRELRKG